MKRVRWAVIGSGGIALRRTIPEGIVPAYNAVLCAAYDADPSVNKKIAKRYKVQAAESLEDVLKATDIDAVYIATPACLHYEQTLACAKAGKHVLCEKPLGLDAEQAGQMNDACRRNGVRLGAAFMMRFQAQHQAAYQLIRDGRLGQCVFARAQLSCWYPPIKDSWRQRPESGGGGALMDLGGHCLDLLEMFFGKIVKVHCFINNIVHHYPVEDSATATVVFENGAMGVVDTFFCIPDESSQNTLELYGSKGDIKARNTIGQSPAGEMTACFQTQSQAYDAQQARNVSERITISPEPINMYKAEIEEFSRSILDNTEPLNNAELGIRSQKILDACYTSAKTGRVVTLDS